MQNDAPKPISRYQLGCGKSANFAEAVLKFHKRMSSRNSIRVSMRASYPNESIATRFAVLPRPQYESRLNDDEEY